MSARSRSEANALIGAPLPPSRDGSATSQVVPGIIPASVGSILVPVFNMVDEGDSTQATLSATIGRVYGIKVGFQGPFKGFLAGMKMTEVAEVSVLSWSLSSLAQILYRGIERLVNNDT
jgi:hypothetical protein